MMKRHLTILIALSAISGVTAAGSVAAQTAAAPAVSMKPIAKIGSTLTGGALTATPAPLEVNVSEVTLAAGASLPAHKHDYLRVVQIVAGDLKVTFPDGGEAKTFHAGQWVADTTDQWHEAIATGPDAVVMRVIDIAPPGAATTVMRPAKP